MRTICFLLMAAMLAAAPAAAGERVDLRLSIALEKGEYAKGEPIGITARLVNISDGEVLVPESLGEQGKHIFFEVRNWRNQFEYGSAVREEEPGEEDKGLRLEPQGFIERQYVIGHDFEEGQYTLYVHYRSNLLKRLGYVLTTNSADFVINAAE